MPLRCRGFRDRSGEFVQSSLDYPAQLGEDRSEFPLSRESCRLRCRETGPRAGTVEREWALPAFQPVEGQHIVQISVVAVDLSFGFNQHRVRAEPVVLPPQPVGPAEAPAIL